MAIVKRKIIFRKIPKKVLNPIAGIKKVPPTSEFLFLGVDQPITPDFSHADINIIARAEDMMVFGVSAVTVLDKPSINLIADFIRKTSRC